MKRFIVLFSLLNVHLMFFTKNNQNKNKPSAYGVYFLVFEFVLMTHWQPSEGNMMSQHQKRTEPGGLVVKNLPCNARDVGLIPDRGTKIPHAAED